MAPTDIALNGLRTQDGGRRGGWGGGDEFDGSYDTDAAAETAEAHTEEPRREADIQTQS